MTLQLLSVSTLGSVARARSAHHLGDRGCEDEWLWLTFRPTGNPTALALNQIDSWVFFTSLPKVRNVHALFIHIWICQSHWSQFKFLSVLEFCFGGWDGCHGGSPPENDPVFPWSYKRNYVPVQPLSICIWTVKQLKHFVALHSSILDLRSNVSWGNSTECNLLFEGIFIHLI
jgi:hypothetical protein